MKQMDANAALYSTSHCMKEIVKTLISTVQNMHTTYIHGLAIAVSMI